MKTVKVLYLVNDLLKQHVGKTYRGVPVFIGYRPVFFEAGAVLLHL